MQRGLEIGISSHGTFFNKMIRSFSMSTMKHGVSKSVSFIIILGFFAGLVPDFDAGDLFFALVFGIFSLFYAHTSTQWTQNNMLNVIQIVNNELERLMTIFNLLDSKMLRNCKLRFYKMAFQSEL